MDIVKNRVAIRQSPLRRAVIQCADAWEQIYRRFHQLEPVGPLFLLGIGQHVGPEKQFADEARLQPGDPIGVLHFNNARIAELGRGADRHRAAWEFTRRLRASLIALAEFSVSESGSRLAVYQGTTWMQPHGLKVGFMIEPLPQGWRSAWLRCHFRLLQLCFSPASLRRGIAPEPRVFWITRHSLHQHFLRVRHLLEER